MNRRSARTVIAASVVIAAVTPIVATQSDAAAPKPTVTSLSATSGPLVGGARITVAGANFTRGSTVKFGSAVGRTVTVSSAKRLTVAVPAHSAGTVDVRVTTSSGTSAVRSTDHYRYVAPPRITSVTPPQGVVDGGSRVTVRGTGFTPTTTVSFGTARAAAVSYGSSTSLNAVSPAQGSGVVHVVAANAYGRSTAVAADRFTYRDAPEPVSGVRAADVTTSSVTLRWTPSPSADATGVVVRRADGGTAPTSPTGGQAVALVGSGTNAVLDTSVLGDHVYSYSLFVSVQPGPLYSANRSITVATPHNSRPDIPTGLTTNATRSTAPCTVSPYCLIGGLSGEPLTVSAQVSDPDDDTITARFQFWDTTGGRRTDLIGPDDPAGLSNPVANGGGTAFIRVDGSRLVDGHLYAMSVTASDGAATSASNGPAFFRYDASPPQALTVSSPDPSFHTNTLAHFHLSAQETTPAEGLASGFDHFAYSFGSPSGLDGSQGTRVPGTVDGANATADITTTPTAFGSNYLYVEAVDRAGNPSQVYTFEFYVAG